MKGATNAIGIENTVVQLKVILYGGEFSSFNPIEVHCDLYFTIVVIFKISDTNCISANSYKC